MKASCSLAGGGRWLCIVSRGAVLMRGLYDILDVEATAERQAGCGRSSSRCYASWWRWCRGSDLVLFVYRARWRGRVIGGCYPNRHGRKHVCPLQQRGTCFAEEARTLNLLLLLHRLPSLITKTEVDYAAKWYLGSTTANGHCYIQ
jgi:hypothetical protein